MGKKLGDPENFRVVIEPYSTYWLSTGKKPHDQITCENIVEEVKRHVDNVGNVRIECDQELICEHCGAIWTEDSPDYNGGCCDADVEANDAALAKARPQ